jgi:hypothetical protein
MNQQQLRDRAVDLIQGGMQRRRNWLLTFGIMGGFGAGLMVPSVEYSLAGLASTVVAVGLLRLIE